MAPPSDIHIQATETDPAVQAQTAVMEHRRRLRERLAALTAPDAGRPEAEDAAPAALRDFCAGELRRHLAAADEALYAPASGAAETRLLVRALRTGIDALEGQIDAVGRAGDRAAAVSAARTVEALLALHLSVEETVLLPALAALPGADLPGLAADFEALLRGDRLEQPAVVDVREIPPGRRHPRIFARYARLAPGESFVLVNNHDPKPLRREFEATHPGAFSWDYETSGPSLWQVRIGRTVSHA